MPSILKWEIVDTARFLCPFDESTAQTCYDKNSFRMMRFETAGESHGECLVATLTGLPAGVPISVEAVNRELWRRQQGYGRGGRMKIETDRVEIVAGVRHSRTI